MSLLFRSNCIVGTQVFIEKGYLTPHYNVFPDRTRRANGKSQVTCTYRYLEIGPASCVGGVNRVDADRVPGAYHPADVRLMEPTGRLSVAALANPAPCAPGTATTDPDPLQ